MPASACRTTPTPSARAGMVSETSGLSLMWGRRSPRRLDRLLALPQDGQHGHQPGDVEDPLDPRLDRLRDADHEALSGFERAAAGVQQGAEHGGVDERGRGQVDDDPAAPIQGLFQTLA